MTLEAPKRLAGARKAWLDLVGDEEAAFFVHEVYHWFEESLARLRGAWGAGIHAVGGEDRVHEQRGKLEPVPAHIGNLLGHARGHPCTDVVCSEAPGVRCGNHAHVGQHGLVGPD